ncbi:3-oxoacyl-[acyl-carrier-protein] synthase III C-terminal domain-containing protein [Pseudomonas sp. 6D_7.1_Bac1]|uniref:3-oxoacyl-[acyl-carrier-protein] synthase III C-terminal domain-containing protein n=1 Tax=Pseudomonas sp. 6D_7.1_Bac1 TaxID=2971615 RepID=UPI0021CA8F95|nr:3-oxoacyl-[acyl-carrier-protein] synthase III C-terminal domain-containing protein [Pseudomonas sp. 6D_7.1_Bac1]MCU1748597.1 3-oxoacyl-ACP synthase [Pseudomonas sp. 6D_7.1_Bac1]
MLPLNYLCWLPDRISLESLSTLEQSHNLKSGACKVLRRYYSLHSVGMSSRTHVEMLVETLCALIIANPHVKEVKGCLVYAKTQTHNTFFDNHWLEDVAEACGIGHWEVLAVSLNHCASALSAIHLLKNRLIKNGEPMLLLTGEKAFHSDINRLDNGVMAEVPAAVLLNAGPAQWSLKHTAVRHLSSFYDNHRHVPAVRRRELYSSLEQDYYDFYLYVLDKFNVSIESIDAIVPCNLDLPMLKRVAAKLNFKGIMFTDHIAEYGHAYCSDVLFNLSVLLKDFTGKKILCLTMGMGITLSCVLIEKNESSEVLHVTSSIGG